MPASPAGRPVPTSAPAGRSVPAVPSRLSRWEAGSHAELAEQQVGRVSRGDRARQYARLQPSDARRHRRVVREDLHDVVPHVAPHPHEQLHAALVRELAAVGQARPVVAHRHPQLRDPLLRHARDAQHLPPIHIHS